MKPCLDCGVPADQSRCPKHESQREQDRRSAYPKESSSTARGYDEAWKRISRQARHLQPFCSDCGTTDDLTTDHSAEAWQAWIDHRPITLAMVDVVCRSCNVRRGSPFGVGDDPRLRGRRPTAVEKIRDSLQSPPAGERS